MKKPDNLVNIDYRKIRRGQVFEFFHDLRENDTEKFAQLTGDFNPLHMDEKFAGKTQFKGRIAHGMLAASFFSKLFGMYCPGSRSLCLSFTINFLKPIKINCRLLVRGIVIRKIDALRILLMKIMILNEKKEILIEGQAKVKVLQLKG